MNRPPWFGKHDRYTLKLTGRTMTRPPVKYAFAVDVTFQLLDDAEYGVKLDALVRESFVGMAQEEGATINPATIEGMWLWKERGLSVPVVWDEPFP